MHIQYLMFVGSPGIVLAGVAWSLDGGAPRLMGLLIIAGVVLFHAVPWGMTRVSRAFPGETCTPFREHPS